MVFFVYIYLLAKTGIIPEKKNLQGYIKKWKRKKYNNKNNKWKALIHFNTVQQRDWLKMQR